MTRALAQLRIAQISEQFSRVAEFKGADGKVRHKCFISYHAEDAVEALNFIEKFDSAFIPKCLGVTDNDPWIDSDNDDYVMDRVREKYLTDSTVTIVLVGQCTWARKYIDWEVYSSLRRGSVNRINGLVAIELPSVAGNSKLPARVLDNVRRDANKVDVGYARYYVCPQSASTLANWIDDAFDARVARSQLIVNSRERRKINSACPT